MKNILFISLIGVSLYVVIQRMARKDKETTSISHTIKKAVAPDQMKGTEIDDLENSKMVSEGSQFGVQYVTELMYE